MYWNRQQKRAYHRILSGVYRHRYERLRFLTLTSASDMDKNIQDCFRLLYFRMRKIKPYQLIEEGWISYNRACRIYGIDKLGFTLSRFDYLKVLTSEGVEGVLHILYFGSFYPQQWLSYQWFDITGVASVVDIRQCKKRVYNSERLSRYVVSQYVSGQSQFLRFSSSVNWCFKGFVRVWNAIKKDCTISLDGESPVPDSFGVVRRKNTKFKQSYTYDIPRAINIFHDHIDFLTRKKRPAVQKSLGCFS